MLVMCITVGCVPLEGAGTVKPNPEPPRPDGCTKSLGASSPIDTCLEVCGKLLTKMGNNSDECTELCSER